MPQNPPPPSIFPQTAVPNGLRAPDRSPRISLVVFAAALLMAGIGLIVDHEAVAMIAYVLELAAFILGAQYLARHSSIRRSPWRIAFVILGVAWVLGALAKLQHWAVANTILPLTYLAAAVLYVAWTLRKPHKVLLDYLKLLWVLLAAVTGLSRLLHWDLVAQDLLFHLTPVLLQILVWLQYRAVQQRIWQGL